MANFNKNGNNENNENQNQNLVMDWKLRSFECKEIKNGVCSAAQRMQASVKMAHGSRP